MSEGQTALVDARGIEVLACANYRSFEEVVDKAAAKRSVDRPQLRDALAHAVDHGIVAADEEYDVPRSVVEETAEWCLRAAQNQYPEKI